MIPASNSVITIIGQDDNGTTGESIIKISKSAMALFRPEYTKWSTTYRPASSDSGYSVLMY